MASIDLKESRRLDRALKIVKQHQDKEDQRIKRDSERLRKLRILDEQNRKLAEVRESLDFVKAAQRAVEHDEWAGPGDIFGLIRLMSFCGIPIPKPCGLHCPRCNPRCSMRGSCRGEPCALCAAYRTQYHEWDPMIGADVSNELQRKGRQKKLERAKASRDERIRNQTSEPFQVVGPAESRTQA